MEIKFMNEESIGEFYKKTQAKRLPVGAAFELTYKCNLECLHCYARRDNNAPEKELTFAEWISVLEQLAHAGVLNLRVSGGEALIRNDFFEILQHARNLNFACDLLTNGTLITEEVADKLASLMLNKVSVTLYGGSEESFGKITGRPELFKNAMRGIRLLAERKVPFDIGACYLRENTLEEYLQIQRIAKDLGLALPLPDLDGLTPSFRTRSLEPLDHMLSESQMEELCRMDIENHCPLPAKPSDNDLLCPKTRDFILIRAYGEIGTCNALFSDKNIRQNSIMEIWKNDETFRKIRDLCQKDLTSCNKCDVRRFCNPCPGIIYTMYGDFGATMPKARCEQAVQFKKIFRKLREEGHPYFSDSGPKQKDSLP